jgi:hypothetical protein
MGLGALMGTKKASFFCRSPWSPGERRKGDHASFSFSFLPSQRLTTAARSHWPAGPDSSGHGSGDLTNQ